MTFTFSDDFVKIGHLLDLCPGDILIAAQDSTHFVSKVVKRTRISDKKSASKIQYFISLETIITGGTHKA